MPIVTAVNCWVDEVDVPGEAAEMPRKTWIFPLVQDQPPQPAKNKHMRQKWVVEVGGMWQRIWGGDFSRAAAFSRQVKSPWHFPGGSGGKESVCNAGAPGSIPGSERSPLRREWLPTPAFLPGEFHGQRSLAGYSPQGRKQSVTTE